MNKKRWIALVAVVGIFIISSIVNSAFFFIKNNFFTDLESISSTEMDMSENVLEDGDFDKRIALLSVDGTIADTGSSSPFSTVAYDHQFFLSQLDKILDDQSIKAVVLYVNSPGGGVIESAEIYDKLMQIKEEREIPIYVSMGSMAASGGYYISAPADKIFAHRETITGSIGVIMQSYNYAELAKKLGIEFETIKSGAHKDMLGGTRSMTDEEQKMLQEMINESYEAFVDVVEKGRNMSEADVKKVADGRILSGSQAMRAGLVDELGDLDDVIASIRKDYDLKDAELFEYDASFSDWQSLIGMKISSFFGPSPEETYLMKLMSSNDAPRMMYLYGDF